MTRRRLLAGLVVASSIAGCRRKRPTPEQLVRALVERLETAIEEKDLDPVKEALSKQYKDGQGNDRATVISTLQVMFLRHPSIHLLVRVSGVELPQPGQARADLVAAMASVPVREAADLPRVNAELYQFTITFAEEEPGVYRIVAATWAPARLEGFF